MYTHTIVVWRPSVHLSSLIRKTEKTQLFLYFMYETKLMTESELIFCYVQCQNGDFIS